ncbi:DUF4128 domain-containing protein [Rhizobium sp. CSW-27]|uniref:DUF4128 domain-containing protein n=1 Tax=Rhizobium sp. CSW-27 TaxID=2839985 RepID=UPI001C036F56|nr:DUF4128 domain-containing protein [Rhizobium sp. CSW-27]MBT9370276.1 DUF4128 domain-containing protein [Rhizobium sp. CSW-27]
MASYAGAEAAIRARLEAGWLTTRVTFQNEDPAAPWPPVNSQGELQPWANLEIECIGSEIVGQGQPGNHVYRYDGLIMVHVFTPRGSGTALGKEYAVAIGEIFRRKKFYEDAPGCYVRTEDPYPAGGASRSDDGNWFGTTMTCPFVYWHRG